MTRHSKSVNINKKTNLFWKKIPAWILVTVLVIAAAGAATGFVFKDTVKGTTTITVSQAIIIDYTRFSTADIVGADVGLPSVLDDGTEWMVHIETNNGDIITIDLPIANLADENIMVELIMWGEGPFTMDIDSLMWWTDADHDELTTRDEAIVLTLDNILDRSDEVRADGYADLTDFTSHHWFFDGSMPYDAYDYNDDVFTDRDGDTPEAILLDDGDGILDPGPLNTSPDVIITPGQAALAEAIGPYAVGSAAVGRMFFSDNAGGTGNRWTPGEDIFLNNDGDEFYTTDNDDLVDGNGYSSSTEGNAASISPGDLLESLDSGDDLYWDDADVSLTFTSGDNIWLDKGDNVYFNSNGESISDANPDTSLVSPGVIFDASLDMAFNGGAASTYYLENCGYVTAATFSTLGLEDGTPGAIDVGDIVQIDSMGKWYIVNDKSADLGQRSTIELIGDVSTSGDDVKGQDLIEQAVTMGAPTGVYIDGVQSISAFDGSAILSVDNGSGGNVNGDIFDGGDVWALDNDGILGSETIFLVIDVDAGNPSWAVEVLGPASKGIPDNYQFYAITLSDSGNVADLDDYYLNSGDDIAMAIDSAIGSRGSAVFDPTGFGGRYKVDSADSSSVSEVLVTAGSTGTDVADDLKLGLVNGGSQATRDLILRGSPTNDITPGNELVTSLTERFSYSDDDGDRRWDNGEDIYEEQTGGAGTYSSGSDTLIHDDGITDVYGGGVGYAGSTAVSIDDDDNIMFRDTDHDGVYDWSIGAYEPLLYTGTADIETQGLLTPYVTVLARYGGDWPSLSGLDLWRLETDFNGANDHNYHYIDHDWDGLYDDGEAIIDQIDGNTLVYLESTDFVVHNGLANLVELPVALSQLSAENCGPTLGCGPHPDVKVSLMGWKFLMPGNNDLGSPLDIRITIALEDAASTCMFEIFGKLRPVNV